MEDSEKQELARKFLEALQLKRWQLVVLSLVQLSFGLVLLTPFTGTLSGGLAAVLIVDMIVLFMFSPKFLAATGTLTKLRRSWWDLAFSIRLTLRESELIRERWGAIFQWLWFFSPAALLGSLIVFLVRACLVFTTH